jgi:hypothetical protein
MLMSAGLDAEVAVTHQFRQDRQSRLMQRGSVRRVPRTAAPEFQQVAPRGKRS